MTQTGKTHEKSNFTSRDLRNILFNLPKIDLHRHLEGSLRLSTLSEIAHQHGVDCQVGVWKNYVPTYKW